MNGRATALRKQIAIQFGFTKKPKDKALLSEWYKSNLPIVSR